MDSTTPAAKGQPVLTADVALRRRRSPTRQPESLGIGQVDDPGNLSLLLASYISIFMSLSSQGNLV